MDKMDKELNKELDKAMWVGIAVVVVIGMAGIFGIICIMLGG